MQTKYDLTYKERLQIIKWRPTEKDLHMLDIDSAIEELKKLKDLGCTYVAIARNEQNEHEISVMGCKEVEEDDNDYNERVQAYEEKKKREHEKDLVEYARIKSKLFPE